MFAETGDPDNEHEEQRQSQREQRLTGWLERRRSGAPYVTADGIADPIADRSLDGGGEPSLEDSAAAAVRELPESLVQRHRDAGAAFPLLTSIREVMDYEAMMERGETSHDDAVASIVARRRQPPPPAGPSEELDRRILAQAALANMEEVVEEVEDPRIRMRETFERRESGDGGLRNTGPPSHAELRRLADADLTRPPDADGERLGRLLLRGLGRSVRRGADAPPGEVDPIDPSLASHLGIALDRPDGPFGNRAAVVDSDDDDGDTTRAVRGMWRGIGRRAGGGDDDDDESRRADARDEVPAEDETMEALLRLLSSCGRAAVAGAVAAVGRARGVGAAAIARLPTRVYAARAGGTELTCAICLEDVAEGEVVRSLPCLHSYHAACIDRWLGQSAECCVCKHNVLYTDGGTGFNFDDTDPPLGPVGVDVTAAGGAEAAVAAGMAAARAAAADAPPPAPPPERGAARRGSTSTWDQTRSAARRSTTRRWRSRRPTTTCRWPTRRRRRTSRRRTSQLNKSRR